jgi:hypothetical protein
VQGPGEHVAAQRIAPECAGFAAGGRERGAFQFEWRAADQRAEEGDGNDEQGQAEADLTARPRRLARFGATAVVGAVDASISAGTSGAG